MRAYIGTKIILAEPCTRGEFIKRKKIDTPYLQDGDSLDDDGYFVKYGDSYTSWSPKAVFESNYRHITNQEKQLITDDGVNGRR